jgi:tetratricopeptide (TPR) repeat protein
MERVVLLGRGLAAVVLTGVFCGALPAADSRGGAPKAGDDLRREVLKLNDITGTDALAGKFRALMADKAQARRIIAEGAKLVKEKKDALDYNACLLLAGAAKALKEYDDSLVFYKLCNDQAVKLQSGSRIIQSHDGLFELYFAQKKYDEAVKLCQNFLDLTGDETITNAKPFVLEEMVQAMAKGGKVDEALKIIDRLIERDEGGFYFLLTKAAVQREAGKYEDAAGTYKEVLERLGKSKTLKDKERERFSDRARYLLSGIYMDLNDIDKAAEQLQQLLKAKPENATYLNDLGYLWADHDKNLDEAERMIRKAIELEREARKKEKDLTPEEDRDVAAYLDSLGWVLFKKKDYPEAKKYLEQAAKDPDGQHVEILDHLGEVNKALGQKDQARESWEKALKAESLNKRDDERKAAVKKKLDELK